MWKPRPGTEEMPNECLLHLNLNPASGDPHCSWKVAKEFTVKMEPNPAPDTGCCGCCGKTKTLQLPQRGWQSRGGVGTPVHKTSMPQAVSAMENPDGEQNNYLSNSGKPAVDERLKETCSVSFVNPGVRAAWGSQRTWLWKTSTLACAL